MKIAATLTLALLGALAACPALAVTSWSLDLEAAMVTAESNDVAIPSGAGTRFSLTDELKTDDDVAFRVELGVKLGRRHHLAALYAPLRLHAHGTSGRDIVYNDETFTAGDELAAVYQFNSYRLRWTYDLVQSRSFTLGLGVTGKIRDAYIELADDQKTTRYDNLGFVPLLNLRLDWRLGKKLGIVIQADGAASPGGEGRAEDVLAALALRPWNAGAFRLGYRFLEGGADVDEVYNFAFISYYVFGWSQRF